MEIISELPCGFLDELNLDNDRKNVLLEQINRFNRLSEIKISNKDIKLDILGNIIFPAGTIIHGTNNCDPDKIASIAKSGILTGQAVGISEDCETYYCADFHRVPNDITVEEFNSWFPYRDGRCPFGSLGRNSLAFVVQPCEEIEELLSYDCYRIGTKNGDMTNSFTNFLPMAGNVASSILYGVPANAISGIVMGDNLFKKSEIVDFISDLFPNSYIISKRGNLIYDPNCISFDSHTITEMRRKNYLNILKIEQLERELKNKDEQIIYEKKQYDKLMQGVIDTCDVELAADVLLATGWQGTKDSTVSYIERLKEQTLGKSK